jgi:phage protein D
MADDLFYGITVDARGADYDLSDDISALIVDQQEGKPDHATIELSDPFKVYAHALQEGMDVLVDLGTSDDHSVVFRGRIYRVEGSFPKDNTPTVKIEAYDNSMKMGLRKRNRAFTGMSLSDVVKAVAQPYFSSLHVAINGDPMFPPNGIRQDDETDLGFLMRLAKAYGCVTYVSIGASSDTFNFIAQYNVMTSAPEVTLYYGRCDVDYPLLTFHSSADVSDVQLPRALSGIDFDNGQPIDVTAVQLLRVPADTDQCFQENLAAFGKAAPVKAMQLGQLLASARGVQAALQKELGPTMRQAVSTFTTQSNIAALAKNQFSTSLHGMRGSGTTFGVKELVACTSVGIQDVGGRFSRNWFLTQVQHTLDREGFNTSFECRR